MLLTDKAIKAAKPEDRDYKLSDGQGMYLLVKKNGSKLFCLKYRFHGKEKKLSFGVYPDVSLQTAREKRSVARKLLADGIDPSAHKKAQRAAEKHSSENTFRVIALEWFETKMRTKSTSYQVRIMRSLEKNLFPFIGAKPIKEITAPVLLEVLRKVESRGAYDTAHRVKQMAGQIFRYAIATGRTERDPTPDLKGALIPPDTTHFAAITNPKEVGRLMLAIDSFEGTPVVSAALKLSALFFCRPGELRQLKWCDINHEENRIELLAQKTGQQHIIPLCKQAKEILEELYVHTGRGEFIFPSARGRSRCMSDGATRIALRTMGYDKETMTPHGFRAMARTLLDEELGYDPVLIEHQLAHEVRDTLGRAYNRTTHLTQRMEMMQSWADYLDGLKEAAS